ncbi:MAG: ATP-dependent zinc metalloprotease FtsH [Clostridia bacterium]|nr:ATP-dependent zinc metalloprotease FtsH [Clostridia bacterium]
MKKFFSGPFIYIVIIALIIVLAGYVSTLGTDTAEEINYNEFLEMVKNGGVAAIDTVDKNVYILKKDSEIPEEEFHTRYDYYTYTEDVNEMKKDLIRIYHSEEENVDIESLTIMDIPIKVNSYPKPNDPWYVILLPYILTLGVIGVLTYIFMKQSSGGGRVMSFGKSRARMSSTDANGKKITFADVAGADEEKQELQEVVDFLKNPKKYIELGARIPKGMLLVGPPGTGKTLLAKASAGEAGVPFFSISGSDFVEMFVGVGASRVRDLFENAKKQSPCIIFIDEIDAVGRRRGAGLGGGHDEREQTLNQLLVEMDGFTVNEGIIILAATNRADILDPALLRPGRFDRQIVVNYPDIKGREEILKVHAKNKPLAADVDLKVIAKETARFTGADLENLLNEAAILSARHNQKEISMQNIQDSIMRVVAGTEKPKKVITDEDKRLTAYHESGHAIVAKVLPHTDAVQEVSIIPRGAAAGYTVTVPEDEKTHVMKSKLLDTIAMTLAGRAAEEIVFGDVSTGAYNDLQVANETARNMITKYGMSKELGLLFYGENNEVFLGMDYGHTKGYSEEMAFIIDKAVKEIIDEAYERAKQVLRDNREIMDRIVERLLEKEKIDGKEFNTFFGEFEDEEDSSENNNDTAEKSEEPVMAEQAEEEKSSIGIDTSKPVTE